MNLGLLRRQSSAASFAGCYFWGMGHNMETLNFLMLLNYWPVVFIALVLLIAGGFLITVLFVRSFIQKHDLEQLQKRRAVLLQIKEDEDTQDYYNKVLLSRIKEPNFRRLV